MIIGKNRNGMEENLVELSRILSLVLRHQPSQHGVVFDDQGWTTLAILLAAVRQHYPGMQWINTRSVMQIIQQSDKSRFEMDADKIRACYGHSVKDRIQHPMQKPPEMLFHGTTADAAQKIREQGLKPMSRQYVHLSIDQATAAIVAKRRTAEPVILKVRALQAFKNGIGFYGGKDRVWLADAIAVLYIDL